MLTKFDGKDISVPSVDYNPRCKSMARLSVKDLNGPFAWTFEEHQDTERFPGVKVAVCELAAGHDGNCETFADGKTIDDVSIGYWLAWQRPEGASELQREYEWITSQEHCQTPSPALPDRWCNRYAGHDGGHAFHVFG